MSDQDILILGEMANKKPGVSGFSRAQLEAIQAAIDTIAAIGRGGYDVSPCRICSQLVVCIPDGQTICRTCAEKAGGK